MSDTWTKYPLRTVAKSEPNSFTDGDWIESPHIRANGIRLIQTGNIGVGRFVDRSKKYISQHSFEELGCKEVYPGDLLICRLAEPIGRACFAPDLGERMITSVDVTIVRVDNERFDPRFICSAINTEAFLRKCELASGGTTRQRISRTNLGKCTFTAPNLAQQKLIAEILSTVDEAIVYTEELIAKNQNIKAGLMHDLFTRGVTKDGQLRPPREEAPELYKESPLGWIPKDWRTPLLDDNGIALRRSGHTPSQGHPEYWNGGVKWLSLADSWRLDQVFVMDTEKEISEAGLTNSSAVLLPAGTVVISRDGSRLGKSGILEADMAVSQHFIAYTCDSELDNVFLYWSLQYRKREFENVATGSTIPTIGLQFFKRLRICCPSDLREQMNIGQILLSLHESLMSLRCEQEKLYLLKRGLMHDLLTGRVPVQPVEVDVSSETKEVSANV